MFLDHLGNRYASRYCVHPLTPDWEVWLGALRDKPNCEVTRMAHADWLMENGEQEEAERQLAFLPAMRWMEEFAGKLGGDCVNYNEVWGDRTNQTEEEYVEITAEQAIEAGWNAFKHDDYFIQQGSEQAREVMSEKSTREEYWKNWQIVTGQMVPGKVKEHAVFSCTC